MCLFHILLARYHAVSSLHVSVARSVVFHRVWSYSGSAVTLLLAQLLEESFFRS